MRMREVYVESSKVSRVAQGSARGIVALLNRLNIGRCVQCDEELRIEHGTLYRLTLVAVATAYG